MNSPITIVYFNANRPKDGRKRRMVVECCRRGRADVLGKSEIHLGSEDASESSQENEEGMWEGMFNGTVGTGLDESYKEKIY